jgi:hypothetical protein
VRDPLPRLLVLDRRPSNIGAGKADDLASSVDVVSRLDGIADTFAPRGDVTIAVASIVRDGGLVLGAWSDPSPSPAVRRRTGGPVLRVPPGALHLAVWSPDRDTWLPTPPDRVANRNARSFARALGANTGGRELFVRDGGVVGSFGWAWGPGRGLTLEVFVASELPLEFVEATSDLPLQASQRRPLAAGMVMLPFGVHGGVESDGLDVFARLIRALTPRVREIVPLRDADVDCVRLDRSPMPWVSSAFVPFAAPPVAVAMGSLRVAVAGDAQGLTDLRVTGELFRPDDLDARWTAALRGAWPDPMAVAATLSSVEEEAPVRPEGTPPLEELAASLSAAISLARDHAR